MLAPSSEGDESFPPIVPRRVSTSRKTAMALAPPGLQSKRSTCLTSSTVSPGAGFRDEHRASPWLSPTDGAGSPTNPSRTRGFWRCIRAKADGRGPVCFPLYLYAGIMERALAQCRRRGYLETILRKAPVAGEFELFYQPL